MYDPPALLERKRFADMEGLTVGALHPFWRAWWVKVESELTNGYLRVFFKEVR